MKVDVTLIIVAGGKGTRMESPIPKQYLLLNDVPIFLYSIQKFQKTFPAAPIILVVPEHHFALAKEHLQIHNIDNVTIVFGGKERFDSVANGLEKVSTQCVMIHDAVRPFITSDLLNNLYQETVIKGNAIPCIPAVESMRMVHNNENQYLDRAKVKIIQTPQSFITHQLKNAFEVGYKTEFTDDASVLEYSGAKINLIDGLKENIKITNPLDLLIAKAMLAENSGFSYKA